MVTAYDYPQALIADKAGVDVVLVGDSCGMTTHGYKTTIPVTMDEMVNHCEAVSRGAKDAFLVGDMPYMSYQPSDQIAIEKWELDNGLTNPAELMVRRNKELTIEEAKKIIQENKNLNVGQERTIFDRIRNQVTAAE